MPRPSHFSRFYHPNNIEWDCPWCFYVIDAWVFNSSSHVCHACYTTRHHILYYQVWWSTNIETLKVKVTLQYAIKIRRGGRDIVLPIHNLCARRWCANAMVRALSRERNSVPILEVDGWALGAVCTGAEDLVPTRIRSADRPASTESLYRLYPSRQYLYVLVRNVGSDAFSLLLRI